jgi:hypothetical protein
VVFKTYSSQYGFVYDDGYVLFNVGIVVVLTKINLYGKQYKYYVYH